MRTLDRVRSITACGVSVLLAFASASASHGDNPRFQPPQSESARGTPLHISTASASASLGIAAETSSSALGAPGTVFRFAQTLGATGEAYISTTTHLNYPFGVDAQGSTVWIGELLGRRALQFASSGTPQTIVGRAGLDNFAGFTIWTVYDVAIDGNSHVWIADGDARHVLKLDTNGNLLQELGQEWQSGTANNRFSYPNSVAFDSQGNIYVSDGAPWWGVGLGNHRVQVFNSSGAHVFTLGTTGVAGNGSHQLNSPAHIAVYSDTLYVADRGNHRVQIYNIVFSPAYTLTYVATLGTGAAGSANGQFNQPSGVAVDNNYIYVADRNNHRVQVFNRSTRVFVTSFGSYGAANGQFNQPTDVAVDASGNLYVADFGNVRVQQFQPLSGSWSHVRNYGTTGVPYVTDGNHYNHPRGVAVGADGSIYIAEEAGRRLVKLSPDGALIWATVTSNPGAQVHTPFVDVAVGADRVYAATGWKNEVHIYDANGALKAAFGGFGSGAYQFNDAAGIGVSPNGDVYVADCGNHRVQVYKPSFAHKATIGGSQGSGSNQFNCPQDVAIDATGLVYVADEGNHRVQVFNSNNNYQYVRTVGITNTTGAEHDRFSNWGPLRLAVDAQNRLYVSDGGNQRVQVFDANGAYLTTIGGKWGTLSGHFRAPFGLATGADGSLYVADSNLHRVQRFLLGVPPWKQINLNGFGQRANALAVLTPFSNTLYAGTLNAVTGAQVWRLNGANWTPVLTSGFGVTSNVGIEDLAVFNDQLYAGTRNSANGAEIWRSSDGVAWMQVVSQGLGDPRIGRVTTLASFNGAMFAGTWSLTDTYGAEIWQSSTGDPGAWTRVITNGFDDTRNVAVMAMRVFSDALYVGVRSYPGAAPDKDGADLWRFDGSSWTKVITDGFTGAETHVIAALEVFNGALYAGTGRYNESNQTYLGGQVWRCSQTCELSTNWSWVTSTHLAEVSALQAFGGHLYLLGSNPQTGIEVWRTDGNTWEQVGFAGLGDSNNIGTIGGGAYDHLPNRFAVHDNRLYLGLFNDANGAEVWRRSVSADFVATPVRLRPGQTVTFTNLAAGDVLTATWNFGDGSPLLSDLSNTVTHTYNAPGIYTVTLAVDDGVEQDLRARVAYIHVAHWAHLPSVMRAYNPNPTVMLYDDFNDPDFNGYYHPLKWPALWGDTPLFSVKQLGGALQITNTATTPANRGVALPLAPFGRALSQVRVFQARLRLDSGTSGTNAYIQIGSDNIAGKVWWAQCSLGAYGGSPPMLWCDVTTFDGTNYTTEYGAPWPAWPNTLNFDQWYLARITVDPNTAQICFYLDGNLVGCHVPSNATALKTASNLVPRVGSWNSNANATGVRRIDDVAITPPIPW